MNVIDLVDPPQYPPPSQDELIAAREKMERIPRLEEVTAQLFPHVDEIVAVINQTNPQLHVTSANLLDMWLDAETVQKTKRELGVDDVELDACRDLIAPKVGGVGRGRGARTAGEISPESWQAVRAKVISSGRALQMTERIPSPPAKGDGPTRRSIEMYAPDGASIEVYNEFVENTGWVITVAGETGCRIANDPAKFGVTMTSVPGKPK
ncbi:LppA family lipoprotein [Nocardia camponoti]|uniref:LppA family lipoprotein n=1 Tax=Nocardia camponoti TaxID=1616106 RepID=UPI0016686E0A|nr:LppA family lipoprotein [Nocardia camponoti]